MRLGGLAAYHTAPTSSWSRARVGVRLRAAGCGRAGRRERPPPGRSPALSLRGGGLPRLAYQVRAGTCVSLALFRPDSNGRGPRPFRVCWHRSYGCSASSWNFVPAAGTSARVRCREYLAKPAFRDPGRWGLAEVQKRTLKALR